MLRQGAAPLAAVATTSLSGTRKTLPTSVPMMPTPAGLSRNAFEVTMMIDQEAGVRSAQIGDGQAVVDEDSGELEEEDYPFGGYDEGDNTVVDNVIPPIMRVNTASGDNQEGDHDGIHNMETTADGPTEEFLSSMSDGRAHMTASGDEQIEEPPSSSVLALLQSEAVEEEIVLPEVMSDGMDHLNATRRSLNGAGLPPPRINGIGVLLTIVFTGP